MSTSAAGTTPAAPNPNPDPTTPPAPSPAPTPTPTPSQPEPTPTPVQPAGGDPPLGEAGQRALQAERDARSAAEKAQKKAEKEAEELRSAQLSEQEKLEQRATKGDEKIAEGTAKVQRANTLMALHELGITGGKAKAAAKLLSGLEFSDEDEPTNLSARVEAAKVEYGAELFTGGATPPAPQPPDPNADPNLHQGVQTPSTEEEERQAMEFINQTYFPGAGSGGMPQGMIDTTKE